MRRKAFWGQSGGIRRQISGTVRDRLMDAEVRKDGVAIYLRGSGQVRAFISWESMFQTATLEQLGAAVAERSEPRTVHGRDCDIGDCVCGLSEPRILPVEESIEPIGEEDLRICSNCNHGVSQHEWNDPMTSRCLAIHCNCGEYARTMKMTYILKNCGPKR